MEPLNMAGDHAMRSLVRILVTTLALLALALPAFATGPDGILDGIWSFDLSNPKFGTLSFFASIHQNDAFLPALNVVLVQLDLVNGFFDFGFATRTGLTVSGELFDVDNTDIGPFSLTITGPGTFTGVAVVGSFSFSVAGQKLF